MEKLESNQIFIFGQNRKTVYLTPTEGEVVSYNGREVPYVFRQPLRKSDGVTTISGLTSGERSMLASFEDRTYKLKGIIPTNRVYADAEDVPFGCMKESACLKEMNASKCMSDFGLDRGIEAPMSPVCRFMYEPVFQGERVSCMVQEVKGDDRLEGVSYNLMEVLEEAFRKGLRKGDRISEVREQFTNRIGKWIGFWYGALENSDLCWGTQFFGSKSPATNNGFHNVVLYPVKAGVGIGLVDLDRSHRNPGERVREYELNHIRKELSVYDGMLYFLENGTRLETMRNYFVNQLTAAIGLEAFRAGYNPFESALPNEDDMEIVKHFDEGRKGNLPTLIDKKFFTDTKNKVNEVLSA